MISCCKANVSRYLANLSEPLHDHVRPRIIHETQILSLSELCLLFQTQFMRDPDEGIFNFALINKSRVQLFWEPAAGL